MDLTELQVSRQHGGAFVVRAVPFLAVPAQVAVLEPLPSGESCLFPYGRKIDTGDRRLIRDRVRGKPS